jgi:hypothetical protein
VTRDGNADPALTTIGVHLTASTLLRARALTCHRVTVLVGDRTELALFLDAAAIDRLTVVLAQARHLLDAPSLPAAA